MQEDDARIITALRAIETVDDTRAVWSDADRAWASQAAAERVGESATPEAFVAARAGIAIGRIADAHPASRTALAAFTWRPWIAPLVVALAFVAGLATDRIGSGGRINILAPPVLGLLAWNVAVYLVLAASALSGGMRTSPKSPGPLRRLVARLATGGVRPFARSTDAPLAAALSTFATRWTVLAAPLYRVRAARVLHLGAAAFAAGVIAGLYLRGLAFEYRASWQSTFLDPREVHALLALVLAPGSAATGIPLPSLADIAAIRTGSPEGGENAARWIHLYAASVTFIVIGPRLALALIDATIERRRAHTFAIPLDEPYFRRMLRAFHDTPLRVRVVPYSYDVPPAARAGLAALVERAGGPKSQVEIAAATGYGGEDALGAVETSDVAVALFNATATPEAESHGAFIDALVRSAGPRGAGAIALVDESSFRERWPGDAARLEQRRTAWRDVLGARSLKPVFVDLAHPDLAAAEADFDAALAGSIA